MSATTQAAPKPNTGASKKANPSIPHHLRWLIDTGQRLKTADGKAIEVWEFRHTHDAQVLSAWARHFREHYCADNKVDSLRGMRSRKDYLENIKFPSRSSKLGPSVRAGDFAEILVADYLQWVLRFLVPRVRWNSKIVRDESSKGSDVLGFYCDNEPAVSQSDTLAVFESKASLSKAKTNRLQDAINDSAKDHIRIDESLNYVKQRLLEGGDSSGASRVERFQNPVDVPYQTIHGAAALYSDEAFDAVNVCSADSQTIPSKGSNRPHPNSANLRLIVIKGKEMMALVHELYRRAADEA